MVVENARVVCAGGPVALMKWFARSREDGAKKKRLAWGIRQTATHKALAKVHSVTVSTLTVGDLKSTGRVKQNKAKNNTTVRHVRLTLPARR